MNIRDAGLSNPVYAERSSYGHVVSRCSTTGVHAVADQFIVGMHYQRKLQT